MAMPFYVGPQESLTGIEKLLLSWVPMSIEKDWKAKLESAYSFMLKYSTVTVCYSFRYMSKLDQNIRLTLLLQYKLKTQYIFYVKWSQKELVWPYLGNKILINVDTYLFLGL